MNRQLALVMTMLLTGCGATLEPQYLDEVTANTISRGEKPIMFFREEPRLAVNARHYVYLSPIEVNRMGERYYFLWVSHWSTLPQHSNKEMEQLTISSKNLAPITLQLNDEALVGVSDSVFEPPAKWAKQGFVSVSEELLRQLAAADELRLNIHDEGYQLWKSDDDEFDRFVARFIDASESW